MSTLLLRLAGPMQSWGTQSRFRERDTEREPSKSGVIGLICAALGKPRQEAHGDALPTLAELATLRMGVRVDREGRKLVDYQTAGGSNRRGERYGVIRAKGDLGETAVLSYRYYLADASFLVGLEGDEALLRRIDAALARPHWQLFLGRKAFVPGVPVRLPDGPLLGPGLRDLPLEAALRTYPWPEGTAHLRTVLEVDEASGSEVRQDQPLDFERRRFGLRYVKTDWMQRTEGVEGCICRA